MTDTKPIKHGLKRTEIAPGKPTKHITRCGLTILGEPESRAVRSAVTISGKVTCPKCLDLIGGRR